MQRCQLYSTVHSRTFFVSSSVTKMLLLVSIVISGDITDWEWGGLGMGRMGGLGVVADWGWGLGMGGLGMGGLGMGGGWVEIPTGACREI